MISKIALDKDTRKAVMVIVTKQAEIDWKDLATYSGIGGITTAAAGGLASHMSSDEKDPDKKRKNTLHAMLTSGLLGAAGGAGAYGLQSAIPGLGTPAETLHGAKASGNERPTTGSGENIANTTAVLPGAMTTKGIINDKARSLNANAMDKNYTSILGAKYDDMKKIMGSSDHNDARAYHDEFVNERGGLGTHGESRAAAAANMHEQLAAAGITKKTLDTQLNHIGPLNGLPESPKIGKPQTQAYVEDYFKSKGHPSTAGIASNLASEKRTGWNPMNYVDNFAAEKIAPHNPALARAVGSSTVRNGLPSLAISLIANAILGKADAPVAPVAK